MSGVGILPEAQHGGHAAIHGDGRNRPAQAAHTHTGQKGRVHPDMTRVWEKRVLLVGGEGGMA